MTPDNIMQFIILGAIISGFIGTVIGAHLYKED